MMSQEVKSSKNSKLVSTYFRNGLKSNLDLTTLADTKAGILISVNGFILTVIITASGFVVHNAMINLAFASIILTALVSIIFAVFAIRPRSKERLLLKKERIDDYSSLLHYDDMANMHPYEYIEKTDEVIISSEQSAKHLTTHLHILGTEIKKKYFWLTQAYTFFSIGLVISVSLAVYGLLFLEQTPFNKISTGNISYKKGVFENIFEPSGVTQLPDGKTLVVEDESKGYLSVLDIDIFGNVAELGKLKMSIEMKRMFKHNIDDLEAVTSYGDKVYAITSHSVSKGGKSTPSRDHLVRFEYANGMGKDLLLFSRLKESLNQEYPELFDLSTLNIEGLAFNKVKNVLVIGLRSPLNDGKATLIEIKNPDGIFTKDERPQFSKARFVDLDGLGIRDLTYDQDRDGFWVVAGSSQDRKDQGFELWFLNSDMQQVNKVNDHPDIGFAEGIVLMNRDGKKTKLFIVQDNGQRPNKAANYMMINRKSL